MILVLILLMMLISSRMKLQAIANMTRDLQETLLDQSMSSDCGACSDPENYVRDFIDETEPEYDTFENVLKFVEDLQIFVQDSKESFCFFVLYRVIYVLLEKKDSFEFCEDEKEIESVIGSEFFARLKEKQDELYLDLNISIFQQQCLVINNLLLEKNLFLSVYELRKKFHYLIKKGKKKMKFRNIFRSVLRSDLTVLKLSKNCSKMKRKKCLGHST